MVDLIRCAQIAGSKGGLIKIIQEWFPYFDDGMLSKFLKPEKYAARPTRQLETLLRYAYPDAAHPPKSHEKAGGRRMVCRPSNDVYTRLQMVKGYKKFRYDADAMLYVVVRGLETIERERQRAARKGEERC